MGDTKPATPTGGRTDRFEWHRLVDDSTADNVDKRQRGRLVGPAVPIVGIAFIALLGLLLVGVIPQATLAHTTFTAEDVSLTTNSGRLTSLTVAPEGDVHYDGLEAEPSSIDVTVAARLSSSSSWETVTSQSISGNGLEGTVNYSFARVDLLTETSMTPSDFAAADGETESTDVDVQVQVTLVGAGPGGGDVTANATDTMTVSVTNEPAGAGVGGRANSEGSGA